MIDVRKIGFHDAGIIGFRQTASNLLLHIVAAQYGNEGNTYTGVLHLDNIQSIKEEKVIVSYFKQYSDDGEILNLDIIDDTVEMFVRWEGSPPTLIYSYSDYEIVATDIYWEETEICQLKGGKFHDPLIIPRSIQK